MFFSKRIWIVFKNIKYIKNITFLIVRKILIELLVPWSGKVPDKHTHTQLGITRGGIAYNYAYHYVLLQYEIQCGAMGCQSIRNRLKRRVKFRNTNISQYFENYE